MNNRLMSIVCGNSLILATSGAVFAADMAVEAPPPVTLPAVWDWSGFYIGVGGSFNWTHLDQSLQGVSGTINVSTGPVLVAQGQEGGPFFNFNRNKSGFAPDVQGGYMVPFPGGDWLAGLKFTYKYANVDSKENVIIPQTGTGTILVGPQAPSTGPITGFVQGLAQIDLKHQLALTPTISRAFGKIALYAGGGPALFGIETNFFNGVPFATSAQGTFPTSVPLTILNNNWGWGGAAQVGAMYAFDPRWYLDLSYTYARSANFTIENPVIVHNQIGLLTFSGPAVLNTQERVTNQSVLLMLNYQFH
jgi:opacity protein-like surface antigen